MVQVNDSYTIRFKFKKLGSLQYISHLDLVRTMHKIVVRSTLPLKYTEGFNPKPKMVFAAPLSIGTESLCEFLDLKLSECVDESLALALMNKNMTDEMQVIEAYYADTKFTELKWLSYTVTLKTDGASEKLCDKIHSVVSDSSQPHGLQPTRLLRPWDFPGKSTGVGCHCLLHCRPSDSQLTPTQQ